MTDREKAIAYFRHREAQIPMPGARAMYQEAIKALEQPEVIRCKDCKYWREGTAFSYCDKLYGMGVLDALDYMVAEDDYCSMAERRTDE